MKGWILVAAISGAAAAAAQAQDIDLRQFDNLKSRASDTVEINLSEPMLHMAAGFMDGNDPKQADMRKMLGGLTGVHVRTFKFDKEGQYSAAEVNALRTQLQGAGWQSVVDVHSAQAGANNAGVYARTDGKQVTGLVVLALEPKQLTVVDISGIIDMTQIQALSGKMGVPSFNAGFGLKAPEKKAKE
jgi:hypothetical protein